MASVGPGRPHWQPEVLAGYLVLSLRLQEATHWPDVLACSRVLVLPGELWLLVMCTPAALAGQAPGRRACGMLVAALGWAGCPGSPPSRGRRRLGGLHARPLGRHEEWESRSYCGTRMRARRRGYFAEGTLARRQGLDSPGRRQGAVQRESAAAIIACRSIALQLRSKPEAKPERGTVGRGTTTTGSPCSRVRPNCAAESESETPRA